MSHTEICPVCTGTGTYTPRNDGQTTNIPTPQTCHGCGGKGWVVVHDLSEFMPSRTRTRQPKPQDWRERG